MLACRMQEYDLAISALKQPDTQLDAKFSDSGTQSGRTEVLTGELRTLAQSANCAVAHVV